MISVGFDPHRIKQPHMGLGGFKGKINEPAGLLGAEIGLPPVGRGDNRQAVKHGFGHGQAKAFPPRRGHKGVALGIQPGNSGHGQVFIDDLNGRAVRKPGLKGVHLVLNGIVDIGKSFNHQGGVVFCRKRFGKGVQKQVDALPGKA